MKTSIYNVTEYEIYGDGVTNNTEAVNKLTKAISNENGGIVFFPAGEYVTGSIELYSNMTLYLSPGAVILGSELREDYPKVVLEGYARGGRSGLVKAIGAENVTIEGGGIIDGRGHYWWDDPGDQHRPRAIQPILCKNIKIKDITIRNSAMWTVHPLCCENVTISGITIENPYESPNTDGINPESCSYVHISDCTIDVGDDCITLKAGEENDELMKSHPCENITVTNCIMKHGHGGVVIGSEMSGGVRNITISNCIFNGTERGIRLKTRRKRGGIVENILVNNIFMNDVFVPLAMNGYYQCGANLDDKELFAEEKIPVREDTPVMKNIRVSNVLAQNTKVAAIYIIGIPEMPVSGISLSNVTINMKNDEGIKAMPVSKYRLEKYSMLGARIQNVENMIFDNVNIAGQIGDKLVIRDYDNVVINGKKIENSEPYIE